MFAFPLIALSAVALGAVPIIIHLLNRRRFKIVVWAAMEFLLTSRRKNHRRVRIEQIILMALRVLAMLLLALALARPILEASGIAGRLGMARRHVILIVDRSFSMGHIVGGKTSFERAIAAAETVVASLKPGDTMSLIAMTDTAEIIIRQPTTEHATTGRSEVMRLTLSDGATNIPAALRAASELLDAAPAANREIVIVTDCQRSAWRIADDEARAAILQTVAVLKEKTQGTTIVDVGQDPPDNVAITSLLPDAKLISVGKPAMITAEVANFGDADASAEVTFLLDGFTQKTQQVNVPAGGTATVSIQLDFRDPMTHTIEARIGNDALPADNRRFLALQVIDSLRVLLVNGEPGDQPADNETYFISTALHPTVDEGAVSISFIDPTIIREDELGTAGIDEYDIVVLANAGGITPSVASRLESYVADGGSVLIFLGDRIDPTLYNETLYRGGRGLLPAKLGDVLGGRSDADVLAPKDFTHALMAPFKGGKAILLAFGAVFKRFDLTPHEDAIIVCTFKSGGAAIVEKTFGRGRVMLFATSADTEWTDLPKTGTFVILMQDVVRYLARDRLPLSNLTVGERFRRALPAEMAAGGVKITAPGAKEPIAVSPVTEAGRLTLGYSATDAAGFYEIDMAPPTGSDGPGRTDFFAVNVDARESNLQRIGPDELRRSLKGFEFHYVKGEPDAAAETPTDVARKSELWRHLLYAVLAILCLETFLAQAFGK